MPSALVRTIVAYLSAEIDKTGQITEEMTEILRSDFLSAPHADGADLEKLSKTIAALQSADHLAQRFQSLIDVCGLMADLAEQELTDEDAPRLLKDLHGRMQQAIGLEEMIEEARLHFGLPKEETPARDSQDSDDVTLF